MTANSLQVMTFAPGPTVCSVTECTNRVGEGRMVKLSWRRMPHLASDLLMNELILCSPCYDTLWGEFRSVARVGE